MRDITLAGTAFHRKGTALATGFRIIRARGDKRGMQRLVDLGIDCGQPPVDAAKEIALVEHGTARRIAMHDRPIDIDEKDRGAETIKYVGKCGRFRLAEIDHLAGANCTPNVGHDETHATTPP